MSETPLQPIVYSLQFRGRMTSVSSRVLEQRARAPSQVLTTTVDANGLAGRVQPGEGEEALLVSRLVLTDDGSFAQSGTIEFAAGGQLIARIDCNRGRGTWTSSGSSHIEFGPLALTRAQCAPGSLHDQIVKQWGNIRSYVIKDGHLFLSLMADGGIYEFGPTPKTKP